MKPAIPVLRIFEESFCREFYGEFLGFKTDWEHRFGPGAPLYMQMSHGDCVIHLSGHFGDACPGSSIRIATTGLREYCAGLRAKSYKHCRPGDPEPTPWNTLEIRLTDPSGNHLLFCETLPTPGEAPPDAATSSPAEN